MRATHLNKVRKCKKSTASNMALALQENRQILSSKSWLSRWQAVLAKMENIVRCVDDMYCRAGRLRDGRLTRLPPAKTQTQTIEILSYPEPAMQRDVSSYIIPCLNTVLEHRELQPYIATRIVIHDHHPSFRRWTESPSIFSDNSDQKGDRSMSMDNQQPVTNQHIVFVYYLYLDQE